MDFFYPNPQNDMWRIMAQNSLITPASLTASKAILTYFLQII